MSITSQLNRATMDGNGVSTTLPITFPFHSAGDLVVVQTIIATGALTFLTMVAPPTGLDIALKRSATPAPSCPKPEGPGDRDRMSRGESPTLSGPQRYRVPAYTPVTEKVWRCGSCGHSAIDAHNHSGRDDRSRFA